MGSSETGWQQAEDLEKRICPCRELLIWRVEDVVEKKWRNGEMEELMAF